MARCAAISVVSARMSYAGRNEERDRSQVNQVKHPYAITTPHLRLYAPTLTEMYELMRVERKAFEAHVGALLPSRRLSPICLGLPLAESAAKAHPSSRVARRVSLRNAVRAIVGV